MANAGVKGSNAGTALRNVFNGLLEGVTLTGNAFGEAEVKAIKADGSMKDFGSTIDELRGYFDQMTESERVNNAMAIAGQRGYAGLLSILNASEADYAKLTNSINNCSGAAQKMADIKLDNLNGQMTLFNSALEAVETTVGEQFTPGLQKLYGVGADVLGEVNVFLQEHPELIKAATAFVGVIGTATAGIVAYSAATKVAIPLMKMFTASIPGVNIIAGVTLGVAALTAAVVALSSAQEAEDEQVRKLTESSRQEYEHLQELQAEYENVVAVYGETSDQALYLSWRIDELSESFETNKKSVKDYIAECGQLNSSLNETLDANRSAYTEMSRDSDTSLSLVHRLQELAAQTDKTVETQEEMRVIIAALNKEVPGLSLSYEDVADGVSDYGAAIEKTVKAQAMMQKYEDAHQKAADAQIAADKAQAQFGEIAIERAAAQERLNIAQAAYNELMADMPIDSFGGAEALSWSSQEYKELEAARNALADLDATLAETGDTLQKANDDYAFYIAECTGYAEQTYANADATAMLESRIEDTVAGVQSLVQAYNEAYESAYASVSGQYALWDEAEKVVAVSAGTINSALESQAKYWEDYNANLQSLSARTGEIAGLSDVIASFADGSKESVNAIAGMATASDDDLKKMVANWQKVQEEQEAASGSIADLKTDFTTTMDELQTALAEDIEAMDLSDEAMQAGQQTIQGFIDAANDMLPLVQAAYDNLGLAAANGLAKASGHHVNISTSTSGNHTLTGYASGTDSATPGVHLVGEYGPELVFFDGGETVLNADSTRRLQRETELMQALIPEDVEVAAFMPQAMEAMAAQPSSAISALHGDGQEFDTGAAKYISVPVTINVEGNATEETVDLLRGYGEDFAERVLDVIAEAKADRQRCAF